MTPKQKRFPENREVIGKGKPPKRTQFKPGKSGNPGGRPKKKPITEAIERLLQSDANADEVAKALFDVIKARGKGTVAAAKEVTDRLEGKVSEKVEHSGADGGPVRIAIRFVDPD